MLEWNKFGENTYIMVYKMNPVIPRSLGISSPEGKDVYEFFIIVKSRPSILGKISDLFGGNDVDILSAHAQVSDDKSKGFIIIYAEMSGSKVSAQELCQALKEKDFVIDVSYDQKNTFFFESMLFPITSGGHYRVFTIGIIEWTRLVKSFHERFGSAAASLLYDEGINVGKGMVERIIGRFQSRPSNSVLIENLKLLFRASGFGILDLKQDGDNIVCKVSYPLVSGKENTTDHFSIGIISGALSRINGSNYSVRDASFEDDALVFLLVKEKSNA